VRFLIFLIVGFLLFAAGIADTVIEYQWWKEVGRVNVWVNQYAYGVLPVLLGAVAAAAIIWMSFARGLKFGGSGLRHMPIVLRVSPFAALLLGFLIAAASIDRWSLLRLVGSTGPRVDHPWSDPVFGMPLGFYLFTLPAIRSAHSYVLGVVLASLAAYWLAARSAQLRQTFEEMQQNTDIDLSALNLSGALESFFIRAGGAVFLLSLALRFYLQRYSLLLADHGFMTGIDWTDEMIRLPLLWVMVATCCLGALLLLVGRLKTAGFLVAVAFAANMAIPAVIYAVYVRPNEINLEKPYISRHIEATRAAFGLTSRVVEGDFTTVAGARIDPVKNRPLLDNIRLWEWRAFHDTVTQIQALRPYYVFHDTDVDRYTIGGQLRQVLLTPRELDIRQLPDARTRWINPHFIYTHGYGMVMAEANLITSDGLPQLLVQDAPPSIRVDSLKLTRPEIYYGEVVHEPVIVTTSQKEFSYPSGNDSVFTRYDGKGGFPIAPFWLRAAAAIRDADYNLLLTNLISPDSRMMIHRSVSERLENIAGFLVWDSDPYLVVTPDGRLVWTADGYTASDSHPYSQSVRLRRGQRMNYLRNSVKATVDAYDGTIHLYIADPSDPIVNAYNNVFPGLFEPASAMPAEIREHLRFPEYLFRIQAEIYRTYHMRAPQAFYNKEDVWDIARKQQGGRVESLDPAYIVGTLPGETKPEFLLTLPFTPRGKDNLIGVMVARCDGDKLGELRFLHLSKQALIFGPMQIDARIAQDPEISKDLTLWNQQGSEVLRGQMLVLPVDNTFLYVEPIYLQSSQARMPQLKKVVVASGNDLVYRNTYQEAIAALTGAKLEAAQPVPGTAERPVAEAKPQTDGSPRIEEIRQRLRRYRELWSQGKYSEAGRELEAVEALVR